VVIAFDQAHMGDYFAVVTELRNAGHRGRGLSGLSGMRPQMKYADRRMAPAAIMLGGDEIAAGTVTIKDLDLGRQLASGVADNAAWKAERPGQQTIPRGDLVAAVRKIIAGWRPMRLERSIPTSALDAIRAPFLAAGAVPTDAPVLQPLGLLLDLAGEAMRSRLFVVSGDGGEEACLRPDFTVAIARQHLAAGPLRAAISMKARRSASPRAAATGPRSSCRSASRPSRPATPVAADAEIAALAWAARRPAGARTCPDAGRRRPVRAFVDSLGLTPPLAARLKRAFTRPRQLKAELEGGVEADRRTEPDRRAAGRPARGRGLGGAAGAVVPGGHRAGRRPPSRRDRPSPGRARRGRQAGPVVRPGRRGPGLPGGQRPSGRGPGRHRRPGRPQARGAGRGPGRLAPALGRHGRARRARGPHDPGRLFGRAFGYYDGFLFEVRSAALGDERPVAAGGRYDGLPARLGRAKTRPARWAAWSARREPMREAANER
jgi:ATP phosphoribosyltransferase regulatory subunit